MIMERRHPVRVVFDLFLFLGRRAKRTRAFAWLGLMPVLLSIVVRVVLSGRSGDLAAVSTEILMVFFLQFYIVLLTLFYGTSIVSEEVEGRTLTYLVTRPVPKSAIILGKYAASSIVMAVLVAVPLTLSTFILNSGRLGPRLFKAWVGNLAVLLLGVLAYTALFTFLGVLLKRAILVGLVFGFGWESVIQYFPGSTQKFSLVHYLKSLLPYRPAPGGQGYLSLLLFRLEPTPPTLAVAALLAVTLVFLALACGLFRVKEYLETE